MIDPTVLRQSVNEHLQNHLAYPADVMAWVMKCGELLDENAALREKVTELEKAREWVADNGNRWSDRCLIAESRLAALTAAGEKVVARTPRACGCNACSICAAWESFSELLRSDP